MQQMDTHTGLQAPLAPDELRHESKVVGALPIINHFLLLLGLDERLQRFLPGADPRGLLPPAVGLGVLLRNMLVSREPLYSLREWSLSFSCWEYLRRATLSAFSNSQAKAEYLELNCRKISLATCGM
jgi:hypothetical protein